MNGLFLTFISPGSELIRLGPFILRWYGLLIAIAVLIGLNLSTYLATYRNIKQGLINDLLPILVLCSVIGARIYYVIFEWREYKYNLFETLAIWKGGIAIHGALIAGSLAVFLFCRWRKEPFWDVLDVLLPSVALGQAIGRWGNFFNNEAFGVPTDLPWKLSILPIYRPEEFADYQYFHPTFLYESLWNLLVFGFLIFLFQRNIKGRLKLPAGALTFFYLISYSFGRLWIEGLRTDSLCIASMPPFCEGGLRVAQLLSILLISLGTLGLFWLYKLQRKMPEQGISKK